MSNYSIRELKSEEAEKWNQIADNSQYGSIFQSYSWLKNIASETEFQFLPLIVEKEGHGPVALIPIYIKKKKGITIACSPPPGCAVPHLGPLFSFSSDNQYRMESEYREITDSILAYLEKQSVDYCRFAFIPECKDIRPFTWRGFTTSVNYTYRMKLNDIDHEEIRDGYDKKVRKMIRKFERGFPDASVRETNIEQVVGQVKSRYDEKGRDHSISLSYFKEVKEGMGDRVQPLGVFIDDKFISGTILLHQNNGTLAWLGGTSVDWKFNGVNEYLRNWIIRDLLNKGIPFFETIGANTEQLCEHKAKYNFRPIPYYIVEKMNGKAKMAKWAAKFMGFSGRDI